MSEEKKFRINAKKFCLTYSQCGELTQNEVLLLCKQKGFINRYYISREKHEDGGWHLHAAIEYSKKLNIKDQRAFDCNGKHPNIEGTKNWGDWVAYVCKDGDFISGLQFDFSNPDNYVKRKRDWTEWEVDTNSRQLSEVKWPIKMMDGSMYDPTNMGKKRHLWVIGKPDMGKTTWIQDTFEGTKVFLRGTNKYPYDDYEQRQVIVFDDILPTFEEIASVSITYKIRSKVYGETRYRTVYYPLKVNMVMIVLSNYPPNFGVNDEAVQARFNIINL